MSFLRRRIGTCRRDPAPEARRAPAASGRGEPRPCGCGPSASRTGTTRLALGLFLLVLLPACRSSGGERVEAAPLAPVLVDPQAGPCVVTGTVLEAASGRPLSGAVVTGPDGSEAVTGADGRFRIKGMPAGTQGELRAAAGDLQGAVRLRPLTGGRLEVVLYLR